MDVYDYDEGNGISATLCEHNAKWHKTCRLTFYPRELERIIARKSRQASSDHGQEHHKHATETNLAVSPRKRRCIQPFKDTDSKLRKCLFCDKPESDSEPIREVMTLEVDHKIKDCANKLQDSKLLAKLSFASDYHL